MILQAKADSQSEFETDIAIIGGGASGLALASHLNRELIVIEAGGFAPNPERDTGVTFETTGLAMNNQSLRRNLIGGAAALWSGRCAGFDAQDFDQRRNADFAGWPISYESVQPFVERAWGALNLAPPEHHWQDHISGIKRTLGLPSSLEPQIWQYAFAEQEKPLHLGKHFIETFERPDKTLLFGADVVRLQAEGKALKSISILDRGKRLVTVKARKFVLACGCVEGSRILLDNLENCGELLAPVKDQLGRGFHQHLLIENDAFLANRQSTNRLQRHLNRLRTPPHSSVEFGLRLATQGKAADWPLSASAIMRYARSPSFNPIETVRLGYDWLRKREPHFINPVTSLEYSVEQVPNQTNQISLSSNRDMLGRRKASVHWEINAAELQAAKELNDTIGDWLEKHGLGSVRGLTTPEEVLDLPMRDSLHHMGGLRMSETPHSGVVDTSSKVHASANLYAVGGATFPSGSHVNPTLMMIAMAIRLADHLNDQG